MKAFGLHPQLFLSTFLLGFILNSCAPSEQEQAFKSEQIIARDSLLELLVDLHITDAAAKQGEFKTNVDNYVKYAQYKGVLELHQVSRARFDSTMKVYTRHPEVLEGLYQEIVERLKEMERARDPSNLEE